MSLGRITTTRIFLPELISVYFAKNSLGRVLLMAEPDFFFVLNPDFVLAVFRVSDEDEKQVS